MQTNATTYSLNNAGWTKVQYYVENDVAGASDMEVTLSIADLTGGNDPRVYLGPYAVYGGYQEPPHFNHWNEPGSAGNTSLDFYNSGSLNDLFPADDVSCMICGLMPPDAGEMDLIMSGGGTGFQFYFRTIGNWSDKAGLGFIAIARKDTSPTGGAVVAGIRVDGDTAFSSTSNETMTFLDADSADELIRIGHANQQDAATGLVQHVRVDNRRWSNNDLVTISRMFTEDVFRNVITLTQGRKYRVASENLQPHRGNWDQMVGTVLFEELSRDEDFVIA